MARIPRLALLGVLLATTACGAERGEDASVVLGTASAAPSAVATVAPPELSAIPTGPTATAVPPATPVPEAPLSLTAAARLEVRFPSAAALIAEVPRRLSVAVVTPDAERYVGGDSGTFALASVVKLPVMLATLEQARIEDRELTARELNLLELMIAVSSNNATDVLWRSLGEGPGIASLLEPHGLTSIEFAPNGEWGDSRATALEIASLLELLISDESSLAVEVRAQALELMRSVVADQRWGAGGGVNFSIEGDATLAIKNGWYPESDGWLLNSAGIISVANEEGGDAAHVVVVLSEGAATQTEGVRVIEAVAAAVNYQLIPPSLATGPDSRTFAGPTADSGSAQAADDGETTAGSVPGAETEVSPIMIIPFAQRADVLVPAGAQLVGSEGTASALTLWYELPKAAAEEVLQAYASSMLALGWSQVAGPPSIVLVKSRENRWVGLSVFPTGSQASLVEVTISPVPGAVPAGLDSR